MPVFTTPITVSPFDGVSATDTNAGFQNTAYLAIARPTDHLVTTSGTDLSLGNTAWTTTGITVTLTTQAEAAKVHCLARFTGSTTGGNYAFFDWFENTTQSASDEAGTAGLTTGVACIDNSSRMNVAVDSWFYAVTAGSHTYTLKYKTNIGTAATLTIFINGRPFMVKAIEEG